MKMKDQRAEMEIWYVNEIWESGIGEIGLKNERKKSSFVQFGVKMKYGAKMQIFVWKWNSSNVGEFGMKIKK